MPVPEENVIMDVKKRIQKVLRRLKPKDPPVARVEVQEGYDSIGDPAWFIWVLLPNGTPESDQTLKKLWPIEEAIVDDILSTGDPHWPYVRFRTVEEYAEISGP